MRAPDWQSKTKEIALHVGDMRDVLKTCEQNTFHACVTDPPYELAFMGRKWDKSGIAFDPATWAEVLRVLRPGAHVLAFGGARTFHRIACAIEDAGFELRDTLAWIYGEGFPKSVNISKQIDKTLGVEPTVVGNYGRSFRPHADGGNDGWRRPSHDIDGVKTAPTSDAAKQWAGWGSALKPAFEPIILARKPCDGSLAANVLKWGCGGLNVEMCRVRTTDNVVRPATQRFDNEILGAGLGAGVQEQPTGRWPANVLHDGSSESLAIFPDECGGGFGVRGASTKIYGGGKGFTGATMEAVGYGDNGSAARFFWSPKAAQSERPKHTTEAGDVVSHPTVKPLALMQYLVTLIVPPGGECLDPFVGSGTTLEACYELNRRCVGVDLEREHAALVLQRMGDAMGRYRLPGFDD